MAECQVNQRMSPFYSLERTEHQLSGSLLRSAVFKAKPCVFGKRLIKAVPQAARLLFLESHSFLPRVEWNDLSEPLRPGSLNKSNEEPSILDGTRNEKKKKSPKSNISRKPLFPSGVPESTFPSQYLTNAPPSILISLTNFTKTS